MIAKLRSARPLAAAIAAVAAILAAGSVLADPPAGKGKGRKGGDQSAAVSVDFVFTDHDRVAVRDYYGGMYERGHCPPGASRPPATIGVKKPSVSLY